MRERRFGVLIANSEFPEERGLSRLTCPGNDVDGLREVLTHPRFGLFSPEDILILKNSTNFEILPQIEDVLAQASRDDLVLLYYSGHGKQGGSGGLHLATRNTTFKRLATTSIPVQYLKSLLDDRKKSKVVLILDCCFSGLIGEAFTKSAVEDQLQEVSRGRGTYILTASTKIQVALEKPGDRYSLLTKHIIEGIQAEKADRDGDGLITMDELYSYVHDRVLEEGAQEPEKHSLNVRGDLIIARTGHKPREERRAQLGDMLLDLFQKKQLPTRVFTKAIEILAMKPREVTGELVAYGHLLDRLAGKEITFGDFLEEWILLSTPDPGTPARLPQPQGGAPPPTTEPAIMPSPPKAPLRGEARPAPGLKYNLHRVFSPGGQGAICVFTPDGSRLVSSSSGGLAMVRGVRSGVEDRTYSEPGGGLFSLAIRPDGNWLAAGTSAGKIAVWDLKSHALLSNLSGHERPVLALTFHPEGRFLASAGYDATIRIWDVSRSTCLQKWGDGVIHTLAFSPDSRWDEKSLLVSGGNDGKIRIWRPQSGELVRELDGHSNTIHCLRFTPDGKFLISAGRDARVKVWETDTWSLRAILRKHRQAVLSLAISPEGEILASASADRTVKLWRLGNGEMVSNIDCGQLAVESVDFSPDGSLLATGGADGSIRLWEPDHPHPTPTFLERPLEPVKASAGAVNLTYDFDTGEGIEKRQLPLAIGVLADFSGPDKPPSRRMKERRFVGINRDNFDRVMGAIRPRVCFQLPLVGRDQAMLDVDLTFTKIVDFEPDNVIRLIPPLGETAEARARLAGLQGMMTDALEAALKEVAGDATVAAVLEDLCSKKIPPADWPLGGWAEGRLAPKNARERSLFKEWVAEFWNQWLSRQKPEISDLRIMVSSWIRELDTLLSRQLDLILGHPNYKSLEATWRGLEYLISRVHPGSNIRVRIFDASKKDLMKDLDRAAEFDESTLFRKVYDEEYGHMEGEPFTVLLGDYYFGRQSTDVRLLSGLSHIAAAAHSPFIAAASEGLFNLKSFEDLSGRRDLNEIFGTQPYASWRAFRASEDSPYVGLVLPRVLLRKPDSADSRGVGLFEYRVGAHTGENTSSLWGNPVYAFGAHLADFHQRFNWFWPPQGEAAGRRVEGLPTAEVKNDEEEWVKDSPAEVAITERRKGELVRLGFIPLCHMVGEAAAEFPFLSSCHMDQELSSKPEDRRDYPAPGLDTLLARSRFAHYLKAILRIKAPQLDTRDKLQEYLNAWLRSYFDAEETVSIKVSEVPGRPGAYDFRINVNPNMKFI